MAKNAAWYAERTERLGKLIDEARALAKELIGDAEVVQFLQQAGVPLGEAQRALTYELGVATRLEYANRPRDGGDRG